MAVGGLVNKQNLKNDDPSKNNPSQNNNINKTSIATKSFIPTFIRRCLPRHFLRSSGERETRKRKRKVHAALKLPRVPDMLYVDEKSRKMVERERRKEASLSLESKSKAQAKEEARNKEESLSPKLL